MGSHRRLRVVYRELVAIAELVVLTLSGMGDSVRLAQEAVKAATEEARSRVQQAIQQRRAGARCASIDEALERQSRLQQSGWNLDALY